jgi:hypothetical protein
MGPIIDEVQERVSQLVSSLGQSPLCRSQHLRVGLVTYRDHGDDYVVKETPLSNDFEKDVLPSIKQMVASGGGDGLSLGRILNDIL